MEPSSKRRRKQSGANAEAPGEQGAKEAAGEQDDEEESQNDEQLQLAIDEHGRIGAEDSSLQYRFRSFPSLLELKSEALKTLHKDCNVAFTAKAAKQGEQYSSGETFWVPANSSPDTLLEQLALAIFRLHTTGASFDESKSGAEWWTQVIDSEDDIGWHWDRDYGLETDAGFKVHPHIATVTYLSSHGAPTIILEAIEDPYGGNTSPLDVQSAYLSHPKLGKHIAFDGRWLHAAPSELCATAPLQAHAPDAPPSKRVTFLVNVWLNHCPLSASALQCTSALSRKSDAAGSLLPLTTSPQEEVPASIECGGVNSKSFSWSFGGDEDGDDEESEEEAEEEDDDGDDEEEEDGTSKSRRWTVDLLLPVSELHGVKRTGGEPCTSVVLKLKEGAVKVTPEAASAESAE